MTRPRPLPAASRRVGHGWLFGLCAVLVVGCGEPPGFTVDPLLPATDPVCCGSCCFIDDTCWLAEDRHPQNDCWLCDPEGAGGPFAWSDASGGCDDGNSCTDDDLCTDGVCGGTPRPLDATCDDDDPCTELDQCTADSLCLGRPLDCGAASTACGYGTCDADTGDCVATPLPAGHGCGDWGDGCAGFVCDGQGSCYDPAGERCAVETACVADGTPHPTEACWVCAPAHTTHGWSPRPGGTPCGLAQRCNEGPDGALLVAATLCDHDGLCVRGAVSDCGAFAHCDAEGFACATSCLTDADCIAEARCIDELCVGQRLDGEPCTSNGQCLSLACVDSVCCATACDQPCWGCAAEITGAGDGSCAPVLPDLDPRDDCPAEPAESCGRTGSCAGDGSCAQHGAEATCGEPSCSSFNELVAQRCDGGGACVDANPVSCTPGICAAGACDLTCGQDSDCAAGAHCLLAEGELSGECSNANRPPLADLTGSYEGLSNVPVLLDASGSSDPDGDPLTYSFTQLLGTTAELTAYGDKVAVTPATVSQEEELIIEVVVNDGELDSEPAVHVLTVKLVQGGCPCAGGPAAPGLALPIAVLVLARRRRR